MTDQELHQSKKRAALSIKKARGTIEKILEMIDQDKYCPEIIQQVDAAVGLLNSSKKNLLVGHLDHCLHDKLQGDKKQTIEELTRIFDLK